MSWSARVEMVGIGPGGAEAVLLAATLNGSGATAVLSDPSPAAGSADGVAAAIEARVQMLSGAAVAAAGASPSVADGSGQRLQAGQAHVFRIRAGDRLAFVEGVATDALGSGENHIGQVGGESAVSAATLTRPAGTVTYAPGQLVANSATAGSVTPLALAAGRRNGGTGMVRRLRLASSATAAAGAAFRVHLFRGAPTTTVGDGGTFAGAVNGVLAIHLGYADVTLDMAFSDGAKGVAGPGAGSEIVFDCAAGSASLYALIEARSAYAASAGEVFTLAFELLRD